MSVACIFQWSHSFPWLHSVSMLPIVDHKDYNYWNCLAIVMRVALLLELNQIGATIIYVNSFWQSRTGENHIFKPNYFKELNVVLRKNSAIMIISLITHHTHLWIIVSSSTTESSWVMTFLVCKCTPVKIVFTFPTWDRTVI